MVLKLYGHPLSTCTQRTRVILNELDIQYEFVELDITKDDWRTAEVLAIQPFGKVPYIDDDGFKLYEGRAIGRYLALKYRGIGTLIPDPLNFEKTAVFEQAASIETSEFEPHIRGLALELLYNPILYKLETNPAAVERLKVALDKSLAAYDVILGKTKYLAGDNITIADLFHLPYPSALQSRAGVDFLGASKYPNVARWWKDISSRPSWQSLFTV